MYNKAAEAAIKTKSLCNIFLGNPVAKRPKRPDNKARSSFFKSGSEWRNIAKGTADPWVDCFDRDVNSFDSCYKLSRALTAVTSCWQL